MSQSFMHAGSFSQRSPRSPPNDHHTPGSDGIEDQADSGVWKRRYLELKDAANNSPSSKRKSGHTTSTCRLGRGIRKVVMICGNIKDLVSDSDNHCAYLDDPEDRLVTELFEGLNDDEVEEIQRDWERSHKAVLVLERLIPNFRKTISEGIPEELNEFYAQLQSGADSARSDDLRRIRAFVANWLNATQSLDVLMIPDCRMNRGLGHDFTGRLLCPIELNWDDLVVRAKIRAYNDEFDWLSSYHSRCFYANYKGDPKHLETGFLKSKILVQAYKAIFTSPSSANDVSEEADDMENIPPTKSQRTSRTKRPVRRNVASMVHLEDKVTPRTIAYAAVQLHFNLQTASSWDAFYGGFDYKGLHNYIVDFFEDTPGPIAKQCSKELLDWWTRKIFPNAASRRQSNISASRKTLKQQRAARERQEAT